MILFERLKKTFVFSVFLCLCPLLSFADVSCPSGYVKISESDSIIVTNSSSCPSGHTKLSDMSGSTSVTNCTTGLSSGFCTYYSESCQSGKYFDGTTHKTCIAGSYCDGSGTATPGVSGCSKACPENSSSASGATSCTCNDGYYMVDGVCEICPIGSYCANNIKTACDTGYNTDNTGSTSESQCYTTCEVACTQQACPDNATCTHGTTTTTGKQYVGGTCDASASQCEITVTCNSGYLLTDGECVQIEFEPEFTITTTKLSADTTFRFTLAVAGTFYIDWGDGKTQVIEKTTVAEEVIEHTYADSGTYTIGLAGDATGYNAGINISSIRFSHDTNSDVNGWKYIAGIDGSLGAIFGTIENPTLTSQTQPRFRYTFSGCTNLTSAIPPELFSGIYGAPVDRMFMGLFNECSKMSGTLPSELFADLSGQITENMFRQSFNSCAGLTGSIPADFFGGLSGELRNSSLYRTFYGCSKLSGYIEPALFANFTESSTATTQMSGVFTNTGLDTVCPANTYNYDNVFNDYFDGRVSCSPCPNNGLSVSGENSEISACYLDAVCSDVGQGTQQCNYNTTTDEYTDCTTCIYTSCNSGYELVDGACEMISFEPEFTITTTEIPANTEFTFKISAAGMYYIDWGDGTIEAIEKTNLTNTPYSHTYELKGTYEIKLAGQATGYNSDVNTSAIDFSSNTYIAGIDGSLGAIFGTLENPTFNTKTQPRFRYTFSGCTNLASAIPPELFSGIYGAPTDRMFMAMFNGCSKLSGTLPANLFAGMSGQITENMFRQMFYGCSSLSGPIPSELFGDLSGQLQASSFLRTFSGCTSLDGYIPPDLFAKFTRPSTMSGQMTEIFYNTKLDTACPVNMYQYKTGYEEFFNSHVACTPCPDGYSSESGSTSESQCYTTCEVACTQQTCPDNATCTHGTTTTTGKQYVGSTCDASASQCELNINCDTGYELKDGTCSAIVCESGYYLDGNECIICPIGSYCANNIKTACDTGYTTDNTGASTESQCYTTCEVTCTQQTCPDNATCTHGTTTTTGKQYVGGTCNAEQTTCEINFKCNENFELIDGECKFKPEFTITTINMSDDTTFMFALSAAGNYVIDWGDGNVELINKTDTARESVWHTYKKGGIYTIGLSGQATKYSDVKFIAAIDFGNNTAEVVEANAYKYIAAIDGGLGAIFSGNTANMFYKTFSGCSHLTTVPKTLFDGVTGSAEYMFANTFFECTNLKTLPENLFAGLYGSAEYMFDSTFARCSALENIPKDLFATISGNALNLFSYTFSYCSALRSIPEELFSSLSGNAMYMFEYTFFNCTSLTEIPKGLFASLSGGATGMFAWTFGYCRNLTSIPSELFVTITDSWENMFYQTFAECTSLQSIPDGLFKNITGKPKYQEFDGVFRGCTNLSGYIPVDMFEKLDGTDFNNSSMWGIFDDTKLAESCPANMYQIITGFESAWSNKVMCGTCPDGTLSIAGSVGIESCKKPEPVEVVITTTEMQPNSEFWFYISASGTFFVDWGDGTIELIERPELSINQYKHKYLAPGVYKIGLSGSATGYADNYCVGFMGNQYVNEVDGSLIDVFGILSDGTNPKFTYSFASCGNLSKISKDLFAGYNGGTEQMFSSTFTSTYSLKEIPEGLFDSITTAAPGMFDITFASSGLTSLPSGMFKNITGKPEPNMFRSTFAAVNDLQGYVPANMFENMDSVDYESGPMTAIFYGTNLAEQCPENMYQYKTGFEVDWSDKVACTPCPAGTTSSAGASGIEQCTGPKSLHIGDDIQMNLTTVKPSTPRVMVFDVLGELYYGGLSETAKPINKNTDKQFRIYDPESNQNYWMHDYTVQ